MTYSVLNVLFLNKKSDEPSENSFLFINNDKILEKLIFEKLSTTETV